jgi:hypothetical protein
LDYIRVAAFRDIPASFYPKKSSRKLQFEDFFACRTSPAYNSTEFAAYFIAQTLTCSTRFRKSVVPTHIRNIF